MLTDEDKQRLRDEEIFRQEVRRSLEAGSSPQSRNARIWRVVNMPFVLWALSSVVLGLLSWTFAGIQASREADRANTETVRKLDTELAGRLQEALSAIDTLEATIREGGESYIFTPALWAVDASQEFRERTIYTDFRGRSFPSLVAELQRLITPPERQEIGRSIAGYRLLMTKAEPESRTRLSDRTRSQVEIDRKRDDMLDRASQAKALVREQIMIPRWNSDK